MMKHWVAGALAGFVFVPLAFPAFAEVIVITQKKARDGGVTPGDAPGFPITISRAGSYRLESNLSVPNGRNGIEIRDFDVTIDFNGFRLHGNGVADRGILGTFNTATIKNGVIAGFLRGIVGEAFWTIDNMHILVNRSTGVTIGDSGRVQRSTISNNGEVLGDGVWCETGCLLEGNNINDNAELGVTLGSGTVLGNTIVRNGNLGIGRQSSEPGIIGFGNNTLHGNNNGGAQVGSAQALQPNACQPAC